MKKRVISVVLCLVLCISSLPYTTAAASVRNTSYEEELASDLKALGLFQGVSETDFDLDREPSRTEALVMLIRVLGKEEEALNGAWEHPFTDVAGWADPYVGYAYENGLTNGVSDTQFGAGTASAAMYLTFVLRALGYSDTDNRDFTWDNPYTLARQIGILPDCVHTSDFWRADVVVVSYAALPVTVNGTTETLAEKLIAAGVFTQAQYHTYYDVSAIARHSAEKTELTAEEIYAQCSPAVFYIEIYNAQGMAIASGSGFFLDEKGTAVTNYHVIEGAASAKIITSDTQKEYDVTGVYDYNPAEDWAVIQVKGDNFPYLEPGDESTVVGGATVYAIGSPLGLQSTISQGIISNPNRVTSDVSYIQTSAPISPGSSGGALINKYGQVIGITSATLADGQNLNLALPISVIDGFAATQLTALSELQPVGQSTGRRQEAYALLKNWLLSHYTEADSDMKFYTEVIEEDGNFDCAQLAYSEKEQAFYLSHSYTANNITTVAVWLLLPEEEECLLAFYVYSPPEAEQTQFYGYGIVDPAEFTKDSLVPFVHTESAGIIHEADVAGMMELQGVIALEFADYIFASFLSQYGSYSVADLGFVSVFAE